MNTAIPAARAMRFVGCAALLALLAASSYAGREQSGTPVVPVMVEIMSDQALSAMTMEQTNARLAQRREEALLLLQSVLRFLFPVGKKEELP